MDINTYYDSPIDETIGFSTVEQILLLLHAYCVVILIVATYIAAMEIRLQLSIKKAQSVLNGLMDWCPVFASSNNSCQLYIHEADIFKLQDYY